MAYKFINPYNFIPLGNSKKKAEEPEKNPGLSGVISYSLLTKTPLFIPNTSNDNAFGIPKDHKSYDFFSYKDLSSAKDSVKNELPQPVIPGSEMRGMLRSNYEILTDSCMSAVDDDQVLSKRTGQRFEPKLLERKKVGNTVEYIIHDAEICQAKVKKLEGNRKEKWIPGTKVKFVYIKRGIKPLVKIIEDNSTQPGGNYGYVMKRKEKGNNKQDVLHIFHEKKENKGKTPVIKFSEEELKKKLGIVIKFYQENSNGKLYTQYKEAYEDFIKKGATYFPVYFDEEMYMLAPACITREVYSRKISDMAKTHESCEKSGKLCPACALFGTLKKENKGSVTSRIRVTDLECMETDPKRCFNKEPVTLQPLSAPKFNPEFYIQKPNDKAVFWTYEYYVDQNGDVHKFPMKFNGRKFYWHHPDFSIEDCKEKEANKQNKTIRPLKAGITFRGKIYFQNISEKELNTLCYLINAGESSDIPLEEKKHGYKLGAAKPLGLGSVAMHVYEVLLRKFTINEEGISLIEEMYTPDMDNTLADQNVTENYANMTDFDYLRQYMQPENTEISYPRTKKGGDIFEWFANNHTGYRYDKKRKKNVGTDMPASRKYMLFKEYLEPMTPEVKEVEYTKKLLSGQNDNRQNRNNNGKKTNNRGGISSKKKRG